MAGPSSSTPDGPGGVASVELREDPQLTRELSQRLGQVSSVRAIGVTDLLNARRAFWRRVGPPVPPSAERVARMESGRSLHHWLAPLFGGDGALEVRVRRSDIVGRIDVLADVPTEVKTSASPVAIDRLRASRPEYLEQLAIYCALVDRSEGRLVACTTGENRVIEIHALDLTFGDLGAIRTGIEARARSLRAAWLAHRADGLPRCPWFGRGCEYQAGQICDCTGEEPYADASILDEVRAGTPRPDLDARWGERLRDLPAAPREPTVDRFRELVYPRRAFFERTASKVEAPRAPEPPSVTADLFARLNAAVESGPLGEVATVPARAAEPKEDVAGFRGEPYLVRTSRAWERAPLERWLEKFPQYALELGFRCAVTGTSRGRVLLGYERAESDRDRLRVVEYRFRPVTPIARLCRERIEALRTALRREDPAGLEACPAWMFNDCPYAARCGCVPSPAAGPE